MHLVLQNAETINRLVEQGELLLRSFHAEHGGAQLSSADGAYLG
jgi:hypothetical protein